MQLKNRIAIIGVKGFPAFGGAARVNAQMLKRLKNKFDITVYTINTHHSEDFIPDDFKIVSIKGLRIKRLNTFYYYIASTFHCLFNSNYDLVHLNHLYSGYLIPLLKLRFKVLITAHGIIPKHDNKWNAFDKFFFRLFENTALKFADHIVSVSKPHIADFTKRTNKPICYIPNGAEVVEGIKKNSQSGNYLLFAAARIISLKGCHIFLEALNIINYKGKVIVVGDLDQVGNYKESIRQLASTLDVEFTGLIKDKEKLFTYIAASKYFVFPSFNEGLSNMLLETASLKTPIIASDIVENTAVFNDNEVVFFKCGNANDLAEKISWALANESEMEKKAALAFEKVITDYNWDNISAQYSVLYDKMIVKRQT